MKITIKKNNSGATLVGIAAGLVVIAIGITLICIGMKWKQAMENPDHPLFHRFDDASFTSPTYSENYHLEQLRYYLTWEEDQTAARPVKSSAVAVVHPAIALWLTNGVAMLSMTNDAGWDVYSLSLEDAVSAPASASSEPWTLLRSTNLVDWEILYTLILTTNLTLYVDTDAPSPQSFYRTVKLYE